STSLTADECGGAQRSNRTARQSRSLRKTQYSRFSFDHVVARRDLHASSSTLMCLEGRAARGNKVTTRQSIGDVHTVRARYYAAGVDGGGDPGRADAQFML